MTGLGFALFGALAAGSVGLAEVASIPLGPQSRYFGGVHPRISPDGRTIAFSYQGAIWRMPSEGGVMTRLSDGDGFDIEPAWSPDGKTIAYIQSRNFTAGNLRLIRADNGEPIDLPRNLIAAEQLDFAADGSRLFGKFAERGRGQANRWLDLRSGALTDVPDMTIDDTPARTWREPTCVSQDGKWIAWATHQDVPGEQGGFDGPDADVWLLSAGGGRPQHVTRFDARIYFMCFDASGDALYITTDLGSSHNNIWRLSLNDPQRDKQKITLGHADQQRASVSRDGRVIIYFDNSGGSGGFVRHDVVTGESRLLNITGIDYRAPTGSLALAVRNGENGPPTIARISIRNIDGKFYAPAGSLYRLTGPLMHFYCRERDTFVLPAGKYELFAFRGPEYRDLKFDFEVRPDKQTDLTVALQRWVNMAERGYFSGENHVHANYGYGDWYNTPPTVLDQCEGEDLNVANVMVANSDGDAVFDREFFRGRPDDLSKPHTILYWNQEFRATMWGHMTVVNLNQLVEPIFTGFKNTTNPWDVPTNSDIADEAHAGGALVSYTHPAGNVNDLYDQAYAAKGIPVDAAAGRIDTMDNMGNPYIGSTMLWYKLLNCDLRVYAAAGTDCFINRIRSALPGWGRAYVKVDGPLTYAKWIEGLRAGRSFVSNGPMIEMTVDELEPGATLKVASPRIVRVRGRAWGQYPLRELEVVRNGLVIAAGAISDNGLEATIDAKVQMDTSGWIALRVTGRSPYQVNPPYAAHTNPVFIDMAERPFDASQDAEHFLHWIDRLQADLIRRDRMHGREAHVFSQLAAARRYYRAILNR